MSDKKSKEKFHKSPLIKRYQKIAWLLPLIIIVFSILCSLCFTNWEYFSRAGALIVIVGIYIAYKDLSGGIYELAGNNYVTMTEYLQVGNIHSFEDNQLKEFIDKCEKNDDVIKKNKSFARYTSGKFKKMEAILLASGTLIWGYGDLILNIIWKLND